MLSVKDTIAAIATPPGKGGVGIIRVSGPYVEKVIEAITRQPLIHKKAHFCKFVDENDEMVDQGIALYFKGPNSFTGEDVVEFHAHGGPVILDCLLKEILKNENVRLAKPGEFSEQAFLNDKIDLAQAEAIADLINATSEQAAKSAIRSLQGEFSHRIHQFLEKLIQLRMYIEAAIDFPEEEIDFISEGNVLKRLEELMQELKSIQKTAKQGSLLQEGMKVVIAGKPNAGKSSLLNALSGKDSAIVTDIEGTTRDVLKESIHIDGMPLHIIDTAGLRDTQDVVEQEGIKRAWKEINEADEVLLVVDVNKNNSFDPETLWPEYFKQTKHNKPFTIIANKIDLNNTLNPKIEKINDTTVIYLSAKSQIGLNDLKNHLKQVMGYQSNEEGVFIARRRHLESLKKADIYLNKGKEQLQTHKAGELLAEDLRQAQHALSEITGEFTSDDLLGKIFSSFCIGK